MHFYKKIVCSAAALMMLLAGCNSPDKPMADVVLINGKVITVDRNFSIAQAVAIKDGRILAAGSDEDIKKFTDKSTRIIDLKGHAVIPGIIDGHLHPFQAAQSELFEEIPDVHTVNELLNWVHSEAQNKKPGEWIIFPKFFATRLIEMRPPTLAELDSVAPRNPVFLNGSFGGMVNSSAFKYSDITDFPAYKSILKDKKTGQPNGLITGAAFKLLKLPEKKALTLDEKLDALRNMLHLYNEVGITSLGAGLGTTDHLNLYKALHERGQLTARVFQNIVIPFSPDATVAQMEKALDSLGYKTGDGDEWVKVGSLKAIVDGGILTGTAFLRQPWGTAAKEIYGITDPEYRGILVIHKKELVNMISVALQKGWKFTSHVTGGGGVDTLLAAYGEVNEQIPLKGRRCSIIHGNFYDAKAIRNMVDMDIYAEMQPAWFFKDADLLKKVLGEERIKTFHPYKSMFDAGVMVNGGSDHMVKFDSYKSINPYNPFLAMWSVITRKTERGTVIVPEEALTRERALKMYTINNAYESFEEDVKGSIEPGKYADLAVLSQDILACPVDSIRNIKVLITLLNGKIVYDAGKLK